jgi:hypothetical protein
VHRQIVTAIARVFGFSGWDFSNEFEIKHELFHQLASLSVDGVGLSERVPGTPTCRLHAEGKILNGRPQKADLLICDPTNRQRFNYEVSHVIELKKSLSPSALQMEMEKFQSYGRSFGGLYVVAPRAAKGLSLPEALDETPVYVLHAENVDSIRGVDFASDVELCLNEAVSIVRSAVDSALELYGTGRDQYHSFYWCNYEHELWRKHSFPSEGDFNAQLYHALRKALSSSVEVRSEVRPSSDSARRIDLVVRDRTNRWVIPIDVKMNWDQFKPAYKDGRPEDPEAVVIMNRLHNLGRLYPAWHAMLVVIQGDWQLPRDIRSTALPLLEGCSYPLELVGYSELRSCIVRQQLGPAVAVS